MRQLYPLKFAKVFASIAISLAATVDLPAQKLNIKNDVFWNTQHNQPLTSQGGGIFTFIDPASGVEKYFWYGVHYKEADIYRDNPSVTLEKTSFQSVTCYSSSDLVNWKFEGDVLSREEVMKGGEVKWVGRLGVAYIKELNKYVMVVQHNDQVLFTIADSPTGKFGWHQRISMKEMIGTSNTGDQTVFTDEETGTSYLIYSYGKGRNKIYVSEIGVQNGKVTLMDCTEIFRGESREGNCMFKHGGKYYMVASNIYGWDSSLAYYLVSDDIRGPYQPINNMSVLDGCSDDYAHVTQTGFFFKIKGSKQETVVYCGDRWAEFAGNGLGYNHWFPISFEGDKPVFNSLNSWNVDEKTGEWEVADNNDFVRNGSFEADRKYIPSKVKPVQRELTGWKTTVLKGSAISLDSLSPILNYYNTESDRKTVIGEKSLYISDRVEFERRISQDILSTTFVKLEDGLYTLTGQIKNSDGFLKLTMYAVSNGRRHEYNFMDRHDSWTKIKIEKIRVRGGSVEIGFDVKGNAGAVCQVDDVTFVKSD
jgi:hypothetical protein